MLPLTLPKDLTEEQRELLRDLDTGKKFSEEQPRDDHGRWTDGGVEGVPFSESSTADGPMPDRRGVVPDPEGYPSPHGPVSGLVFHGGRDVVDTTGERLIWTTNRQEDAAFYQQGTGQVTTFDLFMKNPANEEDLAAAVVASGAKPEEIAANSPYTAADQNPNDYLYVPAVREELQRQGFDGLRAWDVMANYEIQIFVPFSTGALEPVGEAQADEIYDTEYAPMPRKGYERRVEELERALLKYSEDQARDESGRWTSGGGGGSEPPATGPTLSPLVERGYGAITPENYREFWQPKMTPADGHAWAERAGSKYPATVVHMTDADAVKGILGTGFHTDAIQAIHENGAYFATDPESAEFYEYKGDAAISAVVVLQNPLVLDWTDPATITSEAIAGDFRGAALEAAGIDPDATYRITTREPFSTGEYYVHDSAKATTEALQAAGYDGVIIKPLYGADEDPTTGGNQLIVFSKEQAVVIGTETLPAIDYSKPFVETDPNSFERVQEPGVEDSRTAVVERAFQKFSEDQPRDDHGRWTSGGGGLPATVPGLTEAGAGASEDLFSDVGDFFASGTQAANGVNQAEGLKINNVKANGAYLLAAAEKDDALKDQLTIMGDRVERVMDEGFIRGYLNLDVDADPIEMGAAFVANALQQTWAESASDNSSVSLALQQAIADRFDIDTSQMGLFSGVDNAQTDPYLTRQGAETWGLEQEPGERIPQGELVDRLAASPAVQTYVEGVYERTQDLLKERGMTEISLWRGMGNVDVGDSRLKTNETVLLNPVSSFSTDDNTAAEFARGNMGYGAVVLECTVPAERIFSVPMTGPGCLNETEVLVLGGPIQTRVFPISQGF